MEIIFVGTLIIAQTLLIVQGIFGTFDTLYYHEWVGKLASNPEAKLELKLHSLRSFIYASIFAMLAWIELHGFFVLILIMLLITEIFLTLWDFVEEDTFRVLRRGERISHAIMGIIYGAFLAFLIPVIFDWLIEPSAIILIDYGVFTWILTLMAIGITVSAIRDGKAGFISLSYN